MKGFQYKRVVVGLSLVFLFVPWAGAQIPRLNIRHGVASVGSIFDTRTYDHAYAGVFSATNGDMAHAPAANDYPDAACNCNYSASYGLLFGKIYGAAASNGMHGTQSYTDSSVSGSPCASFTDHIKILSDTLPNGSPVVITFAIFESGLRAWTNVYGSHVEAFGSLSVSSGGPPTIVWTSLGGSDPPKNVLQFVTYVGAEFTLTGGLYMSGLAKANASFTGPYSATFTAGAEVFFSISFNTVHAAVRADSGAHYVGR